MHLESNNREFPFLPFMPEDFATGFEKAMMEDRNPIKTFQTCRKMLEKYNFEPDEFTLKMSKDDENNCILLIIKHHTGKNFPFAVSMDGYWNSYFKNRLNVENENE